MRLEYYIWKKPPGNVGSIALIVSLSHCLKTLKALLEGSQLSRAFYVITHFFVITQLFKAMYVTVYSIMLLRCVGKEMACLAGMPEASVTIALPRKDVSETRYTSITRSERGQWGLNAANSRPVGKGIVIPKRNIWGNEPVRYY
jgi:hypothetical protein